VWLIQALFVAFLVTEVTGANLRTHRSQNAGLSTASNVSYSYFTEQRVDHFNGVDGQIWKQRYTVNASSYQGPGSPIFFFLAGEAPMEFFAFQEVSALAWAAKLGALYISLEHRFYGESQPMSDLSTTGLKYLSSQQALADAAYFIEWFNRTSIYGGSSSPWIVFGCSYSGALSAWFRLKYPNLVVGSVAPSGPILAQTNFSTFLNQFAHSADPDCVNAASAGSGRIAEMMQTAVGRKNLTTIFNSCHELSADEKEIYFFLYDIITTVGSSDQMSNPPKWLLNETCNVLLNGTDYVTNFAKAYQFNIDFPLGAYSMSSPCNDFSFENFIKEMKDTRKTNTNRSWLWQTCVEFGFYSGSYPPQSPFPYLPVDPQIEWCAEIFEIPGMTPDVGWTNTVYGGYNLKASNVMFTNGLYDPWHLLSVIEDQDDILAVTYEAGHCGTMIAPSDDDPPSLTAARQSVLNFLVGLVNSSSST